MDEIVTLYHGPMLNRAVGYCKEGRYAGWLFAKHPDGQWVTIGKVPEHGSRDSTPTESTDI